MSLTVSKKLTQQDGRLCYFGGQIDTDSAADDDGEIVTLADFDTTPNNIQVAFTRFKLINYSISAALVSTRSATRIEWTATTPADDDYISTPSMYGKQFVAADFSAFPHGGLLNPMNAGATGGITMFRNVLSVGDAGDTFYFTAEMELH